MIIAFPHRAPKKGGPGSFQSRFENELKKVNWEVKYPDDKITPDVILVVGGTRKLAWLIWNKLKGVPIIYRMDGINWLHRKVQVTAKKWFQNEARNLINQIIRSFLADHVIYQSKFVASWWGSRGWFTNANSSVIHNGVDINEFKPQKNIEKPTSILCVEGNLDYSPYAIELLNEIQREFIVNSGFDSLILFGGFQDKTSRYKLDKSIEYKGIVSREKLPSVYKNAVYLSLDVNAACPNTVIEALASGTPVIGFDTGALKELVPKGAGEIVSYGSDPWELGFPSTPNLYDAANKIRENWNSYSNEARLIAENKFDMVSILSKYIKVIEAEISN